MSRAAKKKASVFFSEEKNQETFNSSVLTSAPAMASIWPLAQEQKSFGSFLQKRTFFLFSEIV
jgi:hypothetical protein